eukprot:scaffold3554_cov186-Ochromonas_danica.AAC.1
MSSRSLLLQLPRDILHSVYSEWLSSWRDLSCLDVGCVGKGDRETWLCSLSELKMISVNRLEELSDKSMRRWYEWVISRKVLLVEMFPVRLSVFAILAAEPDFGSYCPSVRSIEIMNDLDVTEHALDSVVMTELEERMGLLVRECVRLKGIRYSDFSSDIDDIILSTLRVGLNPNTLQSIFINIPSLSSNPTNKTILQLLTDHLSSILALEITARYTTEGFVDEIMNILHEKRSPLKRLSLLVDRISWQKLLVCLSSVGVYLEILDVEGDYMPTTTDCVKGEFLSTLGRSCPQLRRLRLSACALSDEISVSKIYQFYELCPKLISFNYSSLIVIDVNDQDVLEYSLDGIDQVMIDEKEMFLQCICLAIQRSPCKLTISNTDFCYDLIEQQDEWVLMKSKLSPYLTDLNGYMSESILIKAVKDLPHLERLDIDLEEEKLSDLSLAAIVEYGYGLKKLWIKKLWIDTFNGLCFSDEMMSKMIRSCEMLEDLMIPFAGQESVLAVRHHSRLREVYLYEVTVGKEEMSRLLLVDEREGEEKCVWRRLRMGKIVLEGLRFIYIKKKRRWSAS